MKKSARKRRQRMVVDKPGKVVVLQIPFGQPKPYYETSMGKLRASAEWRESR